MQRTIRAKPRSIRVFDIVARASYLSLHDKRLHFGLGNSVAADVTVRWTNGNLEHIGKIAPDRLITVREGHGVVRTDSFKRQPSL